MKTEEELMELLQLAREDNDTATLEEFRKFGDGDRQQIMNYRHYHHWLNCGYKGEPEFNEYGWCVNDIPESFEVIELWQSGYTESYIEVAQLPNGKWVNGCTYMLSESGEVSCCSIWGTRYDTRMKAINSVLERVERHIKQGNNADKKHLTDLQKVRMNLMQPSFF